MKLILVTLVLGLAGLSSSFAASADQPPAVADGLITHLHTPVNVTG